jgi:glucose-1-phosphate thymidylyltransferase
MKVIILAAGYATRLYPLTLNKPKALLKVGDRTVLDYILDQLERIEAVDEVFLVSNHRFYGQFEEWKAGRKSGKKIKVLDDGTTCDEEKLGAIGDIRLVLEKEKIGEDILVIAGDNLFTFDLLSFYQYFLKVEKDCILVQELNSREELKRMGVVLLDETGKVLDFEEKPQNPKSNIAVYASYFFRKETLPLFEQYLLEGNKPDAPGYFPAWLYQKKDVYAYFFEGECFDIGTHDSYREVQERFGTPTGIPG